MVLQNIVIRGVLLVFVEKKPELTYGILHQEGCGMSRPSGVTECLEVQVLKAVAVLLLGAQVGPEGLSDGDLYGVQPTEAAYRPLPTEAAPTFGDYEIGFPPGLNEVPADNNRGERGGLFAVRRRRIPSRSSSLACHSYNKSCFDRRVALDPEPKAVTELAKLPEYTPESGATDFQDYLYLAEQQIGSLASGAGEWWQKTLAVAQKVYAEYQSLSPMKRLSVKAVLTEELKQDRYKKLERKVASLVLSSLPRGVRDELVAHRVQGLHQILFRLMVVFQPGGAQVRSLCNIVKKTSEQNADFKFRASTAATPVTAAATTGATGTTTTSLKGVQPTVESPKGKAKAVVTPPGQKKPCQWFGSDNGCRNGKQCTFVHSWTGLNRGERCLLCGSKQHRAKECPTKDSGPPEKPPPPPPKATTPAMSASTTAAPSIATSPAKAPSAAPEASSSSSSTVAAAGTNKIDAAKMTEILNETNKMLKEFQAQSGPESSGPTPPADPLAMIQQQLDEVRRLKAITVKDAGAPLISSGVAFNSAVDWYEARLSSTTVAIQANGSEEEETLLDSGASHAYRDRAAGQEDNDGNTRMVAVTLATGGVMDPFTAYGPGWGHDGYDKTQFFDFLLDCDVPAPLRGRGLFYFDDGGTRFHKDRFNLKTSKNYVLTVGGGGIWQEGQREGLPVVTVQNGADVVVQGFVSPVRDRIVEVDPKKLHKTMPWDGGPKWTVIAHTVGQHGKLSASHRHELQALGFNLPPHADLRKVSVQEEHGEMPALLDGPGWFPPPCDDDDDEEMWVRMWTRRLLDEEENLLSMIPHEEAEDFVGVLETNKVLVKDLEDREADLFKDRYETEQWLSLCRLVEGEDEVRGVEPLLETLPNPLKVVFTVALDEVKQYVTRWVEAIHKEADALIKAKALIPLTIEEQRELEASGRLVILPAKGVFTVKPPEQEKFKDDNGQDLPPGSPEFFKRKARLVICGNFQGKQAKEDSYAGGCQTDARRIMLVHTAAYGWLVASTDTRNAFILAPIKEEDEDDDTTYALYPPKVFQLAKVEYALRLWRVDRALYGFRRSPRLWGKFRDRRLRAAKIFYNDGYIYLRQHRADENIWSAVVVTADGDTGVESITAHLGINDESVEEWLLGENEASEEQCDEPQLRRAQALTGELLWLTGKSRPDLLHTVATMSSWCLKCPALVEKIGLRALGYLKETIDVELYYRPRYLEQPVAWRCGRQALVALSVAEAELIEAISAAQMSYGVIAVTNELQSAKPTLVLKVDNSAAVGLSSESAGTCKTRHLRVRAYHLREAVRLKEITIEHIPGVGQLGDLGTKAFHRPRLQGLLRLWGLQAPEARGEPERSSSSGSMAKFNGTVAVLARLAVVLGWLTQVSRASPVEVGGGLQVSFSWELYGLAMVALVADIGIWEAMKWCFEWFSLRQCGSVQDARQARRLRRLPVSEEVARYGLDDLGVEPQAPHTPRAATRSTPRPSPFRSAPEVYAVQTATVAVQTDSDDGFRPFNGPFVVSEHGDRVRYEPTCHGLRNATSRRRNLQLCHAVPILSRPPTAAQEGGLANHRLTAQGGVLVIMWRHGHSAAVCFVCCEFRKLHNTSVCTDAALRSFTT
ncbi:unnamed protein product [Symbiodinium microadriaticum]|nr:unnamed protein product [Symbiodinium microadriaticum]